MQSDVTTRDIDALLRATGRADQPAAFYAVLRRILQEKPGFVFATLFVVHEGETLRVFTTEEALYPAGMRKPMGATDWGEQVIRQRRSFLATDVAGLRRAFFDHETIVGLGCGSAIGVPVVYDGRCLGSINLNHQEHVYTPAHVEMVERVAPTVVPAFLQAIHGLQRNG
ncbi:GAF domain-containing protein [Methylobacterium terricola]|uniref:GAF domain-containing protein n=1 Tax=Methylobacterium terricola TaxID=2583531 RepID=A0A5C4L6X1_9HYPH|nr:GAF domain-containing protein [Methylobacterium terricola]TNC06705.1 GAF domain-containing protein [Methylobacterium terricola]